MRTPVKPKRKPATHPTPAPDAEYLSIRQLTSRVPYTQKTIRNKMCEGAFLLGVHYIKPKGRVMFRWSAVRKWLEGQNGHE